MPDSRVIVIIGRRKALPARWYSLLPGFVTYLNEDLTFYLYLTKARFISPCIYPRLYFVLFPDVYTRPSLLTLFLAGGP